MFVDLDGPLNASSLLSASAELLVIVIISVQGISDTESETASKKKVVMKM